MIFRRGGRTGALAFAALLSLLTALPSIGSAQQAPPVRGPHLFEQALQSANLRPDQQAHISQLIASERAAVRGNPDKSARRADRRQLHDDIMATLDPNQRAAVEATLRQLKAERRAARQGQPAPAPQ